VVSGYCPGTAAAGLATGRLDALVVLLGIGAGSLLFAVLFPVLESFYLSSEMGTATLQKLLGVNHWFVLIALIVLAGGMFYAMERVEKRTARP
jgi:Mn2+/Fe2+ NRAMP family transporter